jgi:hypothetical protein
MVPGLLWKRKQVTLIGKENEPIKRRSRNPAELHRRICLWVVTSGSGA